MTNPIPVLLQSVTTAVFLLTSKNVNPSVIKLHNLSFHLHVKILEILGMAPSERMLPASKASASLLDMAEELILTISGSNQIDPALDAVSN